MISRHAPSPRTRRASQARPATPPTGHPHSLVDPRQRVISSGREPVRGAMPGDIGDRSADVHEQQVETLVPRAARVAPALPLSAKASSSPRLAAARDARNGRDCRSRGSLGITTPAERTGACRPSPPLPARRAPESFPSTSSDELVDLSCFQAAPCLLAAGLQARVVRLQLPPILQIAGPPPRWDLRNAATATGRASGRRGGARPRHAELLLLPGTRNSARRRG